LLATRRQRRGVARYRAGEWEPAIAALEKSIELRRGGDSCDWFFLAMAHWQLGNKGEARRWYDTAIKWMDKKAPTSETLIRFRGEAAELLGVEPESRQAPSTAPATSKSQPPER